MKQLNDLKVSKKGKRTISNPEDENSSDNFDELDIKNLPGGDGNENDDE